MNIKISESFMDDVRANSFSSEYKKIIGKLINIVESLEKVESVNEFLQLYRVRKIVGKELNDSNLWEFRIDSNNRAFFSIVKTESEDSTIVLLGMYTKTKFNDFLKEEKSIRKTKN